MAERLRITGGAHRGRRLLSPPRNSIRPASDFLRQAVFNMLGAAVEGSTFYDVFSGTGIVGIEALSRGADRALCIELAKTQLSLLRRNLARAGFGGRAEVRAVDAFAWVKHFRAGDEPTIVFLGPPYDLFAADRARMFDLIAGIQERLIDRLERPNQERERPGALVLQYPREVQPEDLPDPEGWFRQRRYGKTRVGIWRPATVEAESQILEAEDGIVVP